MGVRKWGESRRSERERESVGKESKEREGTEV